VTQLVGYTGELFPGAGVASDVEQLTRAGAVRVYTDQSPGGGRARPALQECLDDIEAGDILLVATAATLSATVPQFLTTVNYLINRGVAFRSLSEPALCAGLGIPADPAEVFAALEALRRRLVSVHTRAGMASAASEGRRPGRPTVMTPERIAMAVELRNLGRPATHIARVLGVSPNAVQRALGPRSRQPQLGEPGTS